MEEEKGDLYARSSSTSGVSRGSLTSLMFIPTSRFKMNDFDMSQVLDDVFAEYLMTGSNRSLSRHKDGEDGSRESVDSETTTKDNREPRFYHDRLSEFFKDPTPSWIMSTLDRHFDQLRLSQQHKRKRSTVKDRCEHLPTGFYKDETSLLKPQLVCTEEVKTILEDKDLKLLIEPCQILFDTYHVGSTFKKICWLRNYNGPLLKGRLIQPSCSELSLNRSGKLKISTGLSIQIIVSFKPYDLKPKTSSFSVILSRGTSSSKREFVIPIIAARQTPTLEGFEIGWMECDLNQCKILNVGNALVGSIKVVHVLLTNVGSLSTFILTPNLSLNFEDFKEEEDCNMEWGLFTVKPTKFTLDRGESVKLEIELNAESKRSFCVETNILCTDNVFVDHFQLIGKAVTVTRKQFVFDGLEKCFPVSIEDDMLAEYYIDLLKMFPNDWSSSCFTMSNNSGVLLKFHWELRCSKAMGDFMHIPAESVQVIPHCGVLRPYVQEKFQVTLLMKWAEPAVYSIILQLILEELTEQSLEEEEEIYKIRTPIPDCQMVSLIGGEIELLSAVVLPKVIFNPSVLEFTLTDEKQIDFRDVEVWNQSHGDVSVDWTKTCGSHSPNFYVQVDGTGAHAIAADDKGTVRVRVRAYEAYCKMEPSLQQTLIFMVNGGESMVELRLKIDWAKELQVESLKPNIAVSVSSQSQSLESSESDHSIDINGDLIYLRPTSRVGLMNVYKDRLKELISGERETAKQESWTEEVLEKLETDVNSCVNEGLVLGVLERGDKVDWIMGDVRGPNVELVPTQLELFLFHEFHDKNSIVLYNRSLIPISYRWGDSYGYNVSMLKVWPSRATGHLEPNSNTRVDIYIYPLQYGEVKELFVPCFIEHMKEPLVLKMRGVVEPLRILLQWDIGRGFYQTSWDPAANESCIGSSINESSELEELKGLSSELRQVLGATSLQKIMSNMREGRLTEFRGGKAKAETDLPHISANTQGDFTQAWSCETVPKDSYLMFTECCGPLGCKISNVVSKILYDKALHFNLQAGNSQSQMVTLKNLTPIKTSFSVKAEIFSWKNETPEYPFFLAEDISFHAEFPSANKYEMKRLNQVNGSKLKLGLYLDIDPSVKELNSYQEVDIWVKACPDVWGEYLDVLVVSVVGLPSYSLPICVDVHGPPIQFTFDPRPQPHLRFGTLCPNDEASYEVTLRNITYVPLKLAWSVYCKPLHSEAGAGNREAQKPFSLAVDLHNPMSDWFCYLGLLDYYGELKDTPFEVFPTIMYIEPYGEMKMSVSAKIPQSCGEGLLEATCVGLIYEDPNQRSKWRSLCHRPTGLSQTYELKISSRVQVPNIQILTKDGSRRSFCFNVLAKDLLKGKEVKETMREVYLKNCSRAETRVSLQLEHPFYLVSVLPKKGENITYYQEDSSWHLHPHQILIVTFCFKATRELLIPLDDDLFLGEMEEMVRSNQSSPFLIHQPLLHKTQESTLSYEVLYPFLKFSSKRLVFGPVFVGETKIQVLRITSITDDEEFSIERSGNREDEMAFGFAPTSGFLRRGHYIEITISFTPRESYGYLDVLEVKTSVPQCCFHIVLEGVGTWNYKFHQLPKQPRY